MADIREIVKLGIDGYRGNVEQYSVAQSQEVIRKALIEANNGKTTLDYRAIRDGKCNGLFTIIEEILNTTVVEGLQGDEFFNAFVDFRNLQEGDQNLFLIEDDVLFVIDEIADGTQALRRQRLGGYTETSIPTTMHGVRIYEELRRILAGRVDFNEMINKVSESMRRKILEEIYTLWAGATATQMGGITYFPAAGTYNEDTLLDLIAHVEAAANGKTATIIGTKKALRNLKESIQSDGAKDELHNFGYYGKFFGTPCVAIPQRHKINEVDGNGVKKFLYDDDVLTIVAGDDKPLKFVYEGDPLVYMGDPFNNMDLTQELDYAMVA